MDSPAEQEQKLRRAISDAIEDSMGTFFFAEEALDDLVSAIMDAIRDLVGSPRHISSSDLPKEACDCGSIWCEECR